MKKVRLFTLVLTLAAAVGIASADFEFGTPVKLPPPVNLPGYNSSTPSISADGLSLFFTSDMPGQYGNYDLWVTTRTEIGSDWGVPANLGPTVNSSAFEVYPDISSDGLSLFFQDGHPVWPELPLRPGGHGLGDLWVTKRETSADAWGTPQNLGPTVNSSHWDGTPCISADGLVLYFTSNRPGGSGGYDIWMATRATIDGEWDTPVNLGPTLNGPDWEYGLSVSSDGLTMFFMSVGGSDGYGGCDLWMTTRVGKGQQWNSPRNLGPIVNSSIWEYRPSVSHYFPGSSCRLYFTRRPGFDPPSVIHEATIKPIVDLDGDGVVNAADMCIMVEYWGTDEPLCDIGPMPWGDGTVDVRDLIVLVEHMTADIGDAATTVGKIIYVDDDAAGTNDGSSWADAFNYLQDALADANFADKPVEIRVAQGTYTPDRGGDNIPGDRHATFQLLDGVTLKGGFAGFGEPDPNTWDVDLYESALSGDLLGNDIELDNPGDMRREPTRAENSSHVLTLPNNIIVATLDGFLVNGGNPHESGPFGTGGGLIGELENADSSIKVRNCTFSRNSAAFGGGVYIRGTSPTLMNCTFNNNWAGMDISDCNVTLANCTFSGNKGGENAGGVRIHGSNAVLMNCTLTNNSSNELGGGMLIGHSNAILTNCMFMDNSSAFIGGGFLSTHESNSTLVNCTFAGNSASHGGGMYNRYGSITSLTNCTFAHNFALQGAGLYNDKCCDVYGFWSSASLINCILWGGENEIGCEDESMLGSMITYSNIQGGWPNIGNIDLDPLFADPDNGDYHLKSQAGRWDPIVQSWLQDGVTSPCIDGGDPMSPIGLEPVPHGGIINMGVYGGAAEASKSPW